MTTLHKLDMAGVEPLTTDLEGWKVVSGTPSMKTYILNTSDGVLSGVWTATPGTYHATYKNYEFVSLLEGKIVITPEGGKSETVKAGDAFVVEPTFVGTWEIQEAVKKYFVVKPKAA